MQIGEYIKELRTQRGISQEELGRIVGVQRAAVQKWECGAVTNLKRITIQKLATYFNVDPANFVVGAFSPPEITDDVVSIPVIGEIAAGFDSLAVEDWSEGGIEIPRYFLKGRKPEEFFFLKVKGDSMYPEYRSGDVVLILRQETLNYSGQVGAVLYANDNATLKKVEYVTGEDWMNLVAINPTVPPMRIEGADLEQCKILGIPKYLIREYE